MKSKSKHKFFCLMPTLSTAPKGNFRQYFHCACFLTATHHTWSGVACEASYQSLKKIFGVFWILAFWINNVQPA
jgi:hypothetical protein